jgi:hypothetical protein
MPPALRRAVHHGPRRRAVLRDDPTSNRKAGAPLTGSPLKFVFCFYKKSFSDFFFSPSRSGNQLFMFFTEYKKRTE